MGIHRNAVIAALFLTLSPLLATESKAQTSTTTAAPNMWGTTPSGVSVSGALDSAIMHAQNGAIAAQVNAARNGLLIGGTGSSIQAIGSQSIVQTTVTGNNNSLSSTATQSSTNSGAVNNSGQVR